MTVLDQVRSAYRQGRAERRPSRRTPLAVRLARVAGRVLPTWKRVRTTALYLGGFTFLDVAAWQLHYIAGLISIGVSLFAIELLGGEK
jgi:hypothetical protein